MEFMSPLITCIVPVMLFVCERHAAAWHQFWLQRGAPVLVRRVTGGGHGWSHFSYRISADVTATNNAIRLH